MAVKKSDGRPLLRAARRLTDIYIIVMLAVFPLFWGTEGYTNITRPKYLFFAAATTAWVAAVAVMLVIGLIRGEKYAPRVRLVHLLVAGYLVAGALSACLSDYKDVILNGAGRFDGYLTTLLYGAIFFGVSFLAAPKRRYAWALGVSATLCALVAILQLMGYDPMGLYPTGTNYYDKYIAYSSAFLSTIGNAGLYAAYLCIAGPFLTVYGLLTQHRWERILLLPGVVSTALLCCCDIDAAIVALAGCVLVTVPVILKNRRASRTALCINGGITAAGILGVYFWPGTSGTIWEISQVMHGQLSDEFGSHRGQIWKECWRLIRQRPWFGYGPGTAASVIDIRWERYVEETQKTRSTFVDNTHNVYLNVLLTTGVVGLACYLGGIVCSMVRWLKKRHVGAFYPAFGSAMLAYLIQDFFGIGLCITAPFFWLMWGLMESGADEDSN